MAGKLADQKISCLFLSCLLLLLSCRPETKPAASSQSPKIAPSLCQDGDILYRYGEGFFSKYFRDMASKEKRYSHVGVVAVSNDSIFVYHADASELTGIGRVIKEPLDEFLSHIRTYGLYRLQASDSTRYQIAARAIRYYKNNTPFDLDFDSVHDNELYCTEMAANCINYATQDSTIRPSIRSKTNILYALDDIYKNSQFSCVMCRQAQ